MRRRHDMPFGASPLEDGGVRFALWAPAARSVAVEIGEDAPDRYAMAAQKGGWFQLETDAAAHGSRYRFLIDGQQRVPDPASRHQPGDVHGASRVVDPVRFNWRDGEWRGRPWEETVLYELHPGTFTPEGGFDGIQRRLDHLESLGVTAVELMPVADWPGTRNWGYDGVYPYAPDDRLGGPDGLKAMVQAAHERGLMVFLDVVYNHFGPEGNYLNLYAPQFFTGRHETPWGKAINFDGEDCEAVRAFFVHNALYWIEEYGIDGLRLDAVHAIADDSETHILTEIARAVHDAVPADRRVHMVLENDDNAARFLSGDNSSPDCYVAQWNDDVHHAYHVLLTGESYGYYEDYADRPAERLGRSLTEGFAYQGEASHHRGGRSRGERSDHLPPTAFVSFSASASTSWRTLARWKRR
jgi:maltooligosyltrehalose trehalohydrolase